MPIPCDFDLSAHLRVVTVHGARAIAAQSDGDATCVWTFAGEECCSLGEWTPTRSLHRASAGRGGGFAGHWVALDDDARLAITADLAVTGDAVWHGYGDNTHEGQVDATGRAEHGVLMIDQDECEVRARRVGRYLVVVDNNQCGGVNVSFTAVYAR